MKIKKTIEKIPAGMVIVPLFLGMIINSIAPGLLRIGGFTEALLVNGTMPFIALFLVCVGSQVRVNMIGSAFKKGLTLLFMKWFIAAVVALIGFSVAGMEGLFLGMAPIAILAGMSNSAGSVYLAIAGQYGREDDTAAYPFNAISDGPFLTMISLSLFGMMGFVEGLFNFTDLISVILPIVLGAILGNIDEDMRSLLSKGTDLLIPFFAFCIGMGISLQSLVEGGIGGVLIGILTIVLTGGGVYLVYSWFGWNPIVGASEGTIAGNAIATPAIIAAASPAFAPIVAVATVQIATAVVVGLIGLPLFITFLVKRLERKGINITDLNHPKSERIKAEAPMQKKA
ncbi:2-keto-3-deoxygluconate permease [Oceanobacillus polygoni]|uniref:2-keto-3-deoxygluconate permease n=1 Tax=Oceanobacillus polygoni TaxID=1235259 RepID=A0A9X0YZ55_9BACI|nr:2-keto-3-deoxygluconate permease [Oceanobacillus polygoni]MBP2079445.1 2-keto-3-deoxygluconate permease [Oceanobacillus polygoni]